MLQKRCIVTLVAGALFATQAGLTLAQPDDDASPLNGSPFLSAPSHQLTVFNPDGSSWSITPMQQVQIGIPESLILIAADMPLPERLTVFEPNGDSYAYEFISLEVVLWDAIDVAVVDDDMFNVVAASDGDFALVEIDEPILIALADDVSIEHVVSIDDAEFHPENIVHFVVAMSSSTQAVEEETSG